MMTEEYNDVLIKLHDYMLNENNIQKSLRMKLNSNKGLNEKTIKTSKTTNDNKEQEQKQKQEIFIPVEQDSLFWCFFIIKNGDIKY